MNTKTSVSFSPAPHSGNSLRIRASPANGVSEPTGISILRGAAPVQFKKCDAMLQSSFQPSSSFNPNIIPQKNGFVDTVIRCYNEHGALVIRPDDGMSTKDRRRDAG
jgi:hypothetical protein